jgi:hypothetical protein
MRHWENIMSTRFLAAWLAAFALAACGGDGDEPATTSGSAGMTGGASSATAPGSQTTPGAGTTGGGTGGTGGAGAGSGM